MKLEYCSECKMVRIKPEYHEDVKHVCPGCPNPSYDPYDYYRPYFIDLDILDLIRSKD